MYKVFFWCDEQKLQAEYIFVENKDTIDVSIIIISIDNIVATQPHLVNRFINPRNMREGYGTGFVIH